MLHKIQVHQNNNGIFGWILFSFRNFPMKRVPWFNMLFILKYDFIFNSHYTKLLLPRIAKWSMNRLFDPHMSNIFVICFQIHRDSCPSPLRPLYGFIGRFYWKTKSSGNEEHCPLILQVTFILLTFLYMSSGSSSCMYFDPGCAVTLHPLCCYIQSAVTQHTL